MLFDPCFVLSCRWNVEPFFNAGRNVTEHECDTSFRRVWGSASNESVPYRIYASRQMIKRFFGATSACTYMSKDVVDLLFLLDS